jgi:hypothetical protein
VAECDAIATNADFARSSSSSSAAPPPLDPAAQRQSAAVGRPTRRSRGETPRGRRSFPARHVRRSRYHRTARSPTRRQLARPAATASRRRGRPRAPVSHTNADLPPSGTRAASEPAARIAARDHEPLVVSHDQRDLVHAQPPGGAARSRASETSRAASSGSARWMLTENLVPLTMTAGASSDPSALDQAQHRERRQPFDRLGRPTARSPGARAAVTELPPPQSALPDRAESQSGRGWAPDTRRKERGSAAAPSAIKEVMTARPPRPGLIAGRGAVGHEKASLSPGARLCDHAKPAVDRPTARGRTAPATSSGLFGGRIDR